MITFTTSTLTFTIHNTDSSYAETLVITVTATLVDLLYDNTTSFSWTLNVDNSNYDMCRNTIAYTDPVITDVDYTASTALIPRTFTDLTWTATGSCVSSIVYTATLSDGTALPSAIQFFSANNTINVYSTDPTVHGSFTVKVTA